MSRLPRYCLALIFMWLPLTATIANAQPFVEGKDYRIISKASVSPATKINVQEFFSYGCPGCYQFEPMLKQWLTHKPKQVNFERVPMVFHPGWEVYARAYYVAKSLNVVDKISDDLFKAIHNEHQLLDNQSAMADFFAKHGVSRQDFTSAYEFMPQMGAELEQSKKLMRAYSVYEIPSIVINGKYWTNPAMVNGDAKKFLAVLDFLIANEMKTLK